MKKFIKKVLVFALIIVFLLAAIVVFDYEVIGPQYKYSYIASVVDKINRLNTINDSKIILVGNSNVAFGIDSKLIEESFDMPVANMGLHGGLGNAFHEELAKHNINKGDIVIICHSDFSDSDTIKDKELALVAYDKNKTVFPIFRRKDYADLLTAYPTYLRKSYQLWITHRGNQKPTSSYSREAFNEYGDVVYKPENGQVDEDYFKTMHSPVPQISEICIDRINEFNEYCNKKGAFLVVAGYPIERGEYSEFSEAQYNEFQQELNSLLDCPVISDYTDYFYPYDYFYDTALHLNEKGRQVRTRQLVLDLTSWMGNKDIQNANRECSKKVTLSIST